MRRLKFIKVNYHHRTDFCFAVLFVVSLGASWRNVVTLTAENRYRTLTWLCWFWCDHVL